MDGEEPVELWFMEYVLENKMKLIDTLDKLKQAISIPGFAVDTIQGKFGDDEIVISIDDTVDGFILDGNILKLSTIETLDGDDKERIENELNLGPQPIAKILEQKELKPHDLVEASTEQITHKMVTRACKGRKLSPKVKLKIQKSLNNITEKQYSLKELFNY